MSKKTFVFLNLFLILVIPSVILTFYDYQQLSDQLTSQVLERRQEIAHQLALVVESRLDGVRDIGIISAGEIAPLIEKDKWEEAAIQLEYVSKKFPYIDRIFLTDSKGIAKSFYPPSPVNVGGNFSFRDWYKGVTQNWQPYASEVFKRAPVPQFNTVAIAVPINDSDGNHLGVLGLAMNLDSFYQLTQNQTPNQSGVIYIVNQKGQIVAHPKYPASGPIIDYSSVPVVQRIVQKNPGIVLAYNPIEKEERLAAAEMVSKYNWGVIFSEKPSTAFLSRDQTLRKNLITDLLFILLNAFLALLILFNLYRLNLANSKLKELDKLKDEFVSIASHELRTPMTAIKGLVSMILEGDYGRIPFKLKDPLEDITLSINRLIDLVNDLLNVSRIEAGRLKFNLEDFELSEVLSEVVKSLQPVVKQKNLYLRLGKTESNKAQADQDKVKQVLNNLIGNSLKFTDQGGIEVKTKLEKDQIIVLVVDTGIGISSQDQSKLFGKFQQISSQQDGRPAGTGLGLYISRQIIQKMGGDLWIEKSEVGRGTIMAFSLPLAKSKLANKIKGEIEKEATTHPDQKS